MTDLIVQTPDGPKFIGREDPANTLTHPRDPNARTCNRCGKEADNSNETCPHCHRYYDDSKMMCPVCRRWFDYLVGSNDNGGIQGCEAHWKPPVTPIKEVNHEVKDVFDQFG